MSAQEKAASLAEKPMYLNTLVPSGGWMQSCSLCGALVIREYLHDAWHASQRGANSLAKPAYEQVTDGDL